MAQAPQGPTGAPRQNKTVKEFKGMNTQNRRNAIPEGSFAWLENIQPIGPGHLHSIPGRSQALVRIPPTIPPETCTDSTLRGQQPLSIEDRFDQVNSNPILGANLRTGWGYITANEEVYTLIGNQSGTGGNMAYNSDDCRINHWQSPPILSHPALIDPVLEPTGPLMGTSDEFIYARKLGSDLHSYYPNNNNGHIHNVLNQATIDNLIWQSQENLFAKIASTFYTVAHAQAAPVANFTHIVGFNLLIDNSSQSEDFDLGEPFTVIQLAATTLHVYVLGYPTAGGTPEMQIRKILRADGSLVDTFMLDDISTMNIGLVSDNLIYVLSNTAGELSLRYLTTFTTLTYVGHVTGLGLSPFGPSTGLFIGGGFYYGNNGASGFTTDIFKITVACPEGSPPSPVIATVSRGSASVVAGATINASWANVLEPSASDTIQLHSAPTGDDLGFTAASLINSQLTDGLGTSSIVYTIPGGTPAGTYVFMYAANSTMYVATSPTFTVT